MTTFQIAAAYVIALIFLIAVVVIVMTKISDAFDWQSDENWSDGDPVNYKGDRHAPK